MAFEDVIVRTTWTAIKYGGVWLSADLKNTPSAKKSHDRITAASDDTFIVTNS